MENKPIRPQNQEDDIRRPQDTNKNNMARKMALMGLLLAFNSIIYTGQLYTYKYYSPFGSSQPTCPGGSSRIWSKKWGPLHLGIYHLSLFTDRQQGPLCDLPTNLFYLSPNKGPGRKNRVT